jgi:hypothetical protein
MYVIKPFLGYQPSQVAQIHNCAHSHSHTHTQSITLICALCRRIVVIKNSGRQIFPYTSELFSSLRVQKVFNTQTFFCMYASCKERAMKTTSLQPQKTLMSNKMGKDNKTLFGQHPE